MSYQADFIGLGPGGELVLVEAKAIRGTNENWAARMWRNIAAHTLERDVRYFVLATPERFYGWSNPPLAGEEVPPAWTLDARTIMEPYAERAGLTLEDIQGEAWEHLVGAWARDLVDGSPTGGDGSRFIGVEALRHALAGGLLSYGTRA